MTALTDAVYRFHWRLGYDRNMIPADFETFESVMNGWGNTEK